ncbi:hypothetical protein KL86PLE_70067 [uncultured Pleomorphomonas sp.]|uniref:Uncharacterized protein n=1 Tax=uncultured Pleomorphomonas sp. TaxID=442121 RepID=A0A212LL58_9HYPH|nr:hypothetical protein KL86PLE_70067 [uncultured Pleomorphomonas sp.]
MGGAVMIMIWYGTGRKQEPRS